MTDQPDSTEHPARAQPRHRTRSQWAIKVVQVAAGIGLAVLLLWWGLPLLTHTSWDRIVEHLARLPASTALLGVLLMFGGLYCYTFTMAASLPGLSHGQALMVNLIGSGVSNAMPGGGAVGAAAQYGVFRSWGFGHRSIGTSILVAAIWNFLIRLLMPLGAVLWLLAGGDDRLPPAAIRGALIGGVAAAALSVIVAAVLISPSVAHFIGHSLNRVAAPVLRMMGRSHSRDVEALAADVRARMVDVVRGGWPGLTLGLVGFLGTYAFLYWVCMRAFGIDLGPDKAFACYALSRLLTLIPLTPGGIGTTEVGPAALMVAMGAHGTSAAAAVFLFAVYSHLLEIPFGALAGAAWVRTRERYARQRAEQASD